MAVSGLCQAPFLGLCCFFLLPGSLQAQPNFRDMPLPSAPSGIDDNKWDDRVEEPLPSAPSSFQEEPLPSAPSSPKVSKWQEEDWGVNMAKVIMDTQPREARPSSPWDTPLPNAPSQWQQDPEPLRRTPLPKQEAHGPLRDMPLPSAPSSYAPSKWMQEESPARGPMREEAGVNMAKIIATQRSGVERPTFESASPTSEFGVSDQSASLTNEQNPWLMPMASSQEKAPELIAGSWHDAHNDLMKDRLLKKRLEELAAEQRELLQVAKQPKKPESLTQEQWDEEEDIRKAQEAAMSQIREKEQRRARMDREVQQEEVSRQARYRAGVELAKKQEYDRTASRYSETRKAVETHDAALADLQRQQEEIARKKQDLDQTLEREKVDIEHRAAERHQQREHNYLITSISKSAAKRRAEAAEAEKPAAEQFDELKPVQVPDMSDLSLEVVTAVKDARFSYTVAQAAKELPKVVGAFKESSKDMVTKFVEDSKGASDEVFLQLVAKFFEQNWKLLLRHQKEAEGLRSTLEGVMPVDLHKALSPMMGMFTDNIAPNMFNVTRLAASGDNVQFCDRIEASVGEYADQVTKMRKVLDAAAKMAPEVSSKAEKAIQNNEALPGLVLTMQKKWSLSSEASAFLSNSVDLGYMEFLSLEEVSAEIASTVVPIIKDRLACHMESAAAPLGAGLLGLVAAVLSLAAW